MFLRLSVFILIAFLASCASRPHPQVFERPDLGSGFREARIR